MWPFVLVLLESGEYIIVAAEYGNYQETCVPLLKRFRPDLAVDCEKGGGVITVHPKGRGGTPHMSIRFCLDRFYKQPDWAIVQQILQKDFPEAMVWQSPK